MTSLERAEPVAQIGQAAVIESVDQLYQCPVADPPDRSEVEGSSPCHEPRALDEVVAVAQEKEEPRDLSGVMLPSASIITIRSPEQLRSRPAARPPSPCPAASAPRGPASRSWPSRSSHRWNGRRRG